MKIALGEFAKSSIESHFGTRFAAAVHAVLVHYERRLRSSSPPIDVPRFIREQRPGDGKSFEYELAISPETQALLEREAARQGVSIDQIFAHAVFVYLADMDSSFEANPYPGASPSTEIRAEAGPKESRRTLTAVETGPVDRG